MLKPGSPARREDILHTGRTDGEPPPGLLLFFPRIFRLTSGTECDSVVNPNENRKGERGHEKRRWWATWR